MIRRLISFLALALVPAGFLRAAEPQEEAVIVVEGQRLTREEVRAKANDFIRRIGVVQGQRSVARWVQGVCPKVMGLSPEHARIVADRIRRTAQAIGAPVAKEACETNLLLAFVGDGKDMVAIIDEKRPARMTQVQGPERRALLESDAPVRWWYTIGTGSGDGGQAASAPSPVTGGNAEGGGSVLLDGVPIASSYAPSLIRTQAIRTLAAATVIIDVNRAAGVSLNAVTSYAAFVGLAEIRNRPDAPVPSILNLFGVQDHASDLTDWDRRFLVELYDLPLNRFGRTQRGHLVKALVDKDGPDEGD